MAASLEMQAAKAAIKRKITEDRLAESVARRHLAYINENLKPSLHRKIGVTTPDDPSRDFSTYDRRKAMAMARQKIEEQALASAILQAHIDHVVGVEFRLRMITGDKAWDRKVEQWWKSIKNKLDIRGLRSWGALCRNWQARKKIDGDVGILMLPDGEASYVQTIEADRISKDPASPKDDGIDFDQYGAPNKFYVSNRADKKNKPKEYDWKEFIFLMDDFSERSERTRGVSAFLPILNLMEDYSDIIKNIVQKVKNETFIGLKFTMEPNPSGINFHGGESVPSSTGADYSRVKMVSGMNLVMAPGENAEVIQSASPNAQFQEFERLLASRIPFIFGITYEMITGDYSRINYTSSRAMFEGVRKRVRREQSDLSLATSRIFQWALSRAVKAGTLTPPSELDGKWWTHGWGTPGFPSLNPAQEAQANATRIERGLTSRSRVLAEEGDDDFDDVLADLEYETKLLRESDVPVVVTPGGATEQSLQPAANQDEPQNA